MSDVAIRLSGVTKSYGVGAQASRALEDVDFEVRKGAFVSLMGPSGSGKTTLLNLIAGLDVPDSGEVIVENTNLGMLADHELADLRLQKIGFIFQAFNLIPALTVEENVGLFLEFGGRSRAEVRRMTAEALQQVGVLDRDRRYPGELSGGEQQRVAIARAIVGRPSILLADEPTGNLDSHTGQMILDMLSALNRSQGVTVLMVTHNLFAAMYGERTLEMQDGRIIRDVRVPERTTGLTLVARER